MPPTLNQIRDTVSRFLLYNYRISTKEKTTNFYECKDIDGLVSALHALMTEQSSGGGPAPDVFTCETSRFGCECRVWLYPKSQTPNGLVITISKSILDTDNGNYFVSVYRTSQNMMYYEDITNLYPTFLDDTQRDVRTRKMYITFKSAVRDIKREFVATPTWPDHKTCCGRSGECNC